MSRVRFRFSLLNMLMLMTIIALAISVVLLWREVGPARVELRRLRAETGQLTVEKPNQANGVCIRKDRDSWRWRLYLPPRGTNAYTLRCASGHFPGVVHDDKWYAAVQSGGNHCVSSPIRVDGEFTIQCSLTKEGDKWIIDSKYAREITGIMIPGGLTTALFQSSGDWLGIESRWVASSFDEGVQRDFQPGEPILLLHIMRPEIETLPSGNRSTHAPTGAADGVALWIECNANAPAK